MEQYLTEFLEKMTTSRNIPELFGKILYREFVFNLIFSRNFIFRGLLSYGLSKILQFPDFLKTFRGDFHTICTRFEYFGMNLLEWKAPLICFSSDYTRKVVILKLTADTLFHFRILSSGREVSCSGGSCGGISLKSDKCHFQQQQPLFTLFR